MIVYIHGHILILMDYIKKQESNFSLTFKDINYQVKVKSQDENKFVDKVIINNSSGQVNSGEIMAIMGPSGSGKTSLLNFLTDRIEFPKDSKHSGNIYINSQEIQFKDITHYSSYVMQDDVLFDILTPYEIIKFSCQLKQITEEDKIEDCVNAFLNELYIYDCKDTMIGNSEIKGVSGGERKRTSIGVELIKSPPIVFLDEPTSGLDSQTSYKIISLLKKLAVEKNIIIISTIHQPSSNIFFLFDKLNIIERGNTIFNDNPKNLPAYFSSIGTPLKEKSNPSDAFMKLLELNSSSKTPNFYIDSYKSRNEEIKKQIDSYLSTNKEGVTSIKTSESEGSFSNNTSVLTKRSALNVIRNPGLLKMRIGFTITMAFFAASVFWRLDGKTYEGVYGRVGFFFFISINLFMTQVMGTLLTFPVERAVFIREYCSKMYAIPEYYTSKVLVETPFIVFFTIIFTLIIYFTTGLRGEAGPFFIYTAALLVHSLVGQSLGYCLGTLFSNINEALGIANIMLMPFILFAGTLISVQNMPKYLHWISYISPLKYTIEILSTNEFKDNKKIVFGDGANKILETFQYDLGIGYCFLIMCLAMAFLRVLPPFFLKLMIRKTG